MSFKIDLTKDWLGDPNVQAQAIHALIGLSLMLVVALLAGMIGCFIALPVIIGLAAIKEFWIDATYEVPKQTWQDNLLDFGMYMLGSSIGMGVACISYYALHRRL